MRPLEKQKDNLKIIRNWPRGLVVGVAAEKELLCTGRFGPRVGLQGAQLCKAHFVCYHNKIETTEFRKALIQRLHDLGFLWASCMWEL